VYEKRQNLLENGKWQMANGEKGSNYQLQITNYQLALSMLDMLWMNHLEGMEELRDSVRLRAYAQHDPLVEYRRESQMLFRQLLDEFEKWMEEHKDKIQQAAAEHKHAPRPIEMKSTHPGGYDKQQTTNNLRQTTSYGNKVGRNDPCPCGSGKKFKKCHGA
jgi:preprotein translocase subunit SecA